ncbi:MAG: glycoside hydrolase [Acidobacteriota bacterium]
MAKTHKVLFFIVAMICLSLLVCAQSQKRIYIANDNHTDYMWVADEATYRRVFIELLDYYMNLSDTTANEPSHFQSRFNADGMFWIWTYEQNKTATAFNRLIDKIRSGHITTPMTLLTLCYGGMPAEAVFRSMYYSGRLERRFGLRFPLAMSQENQTMPYGLGALWAGSGVEYSWKGICNCATRVSNAWDRRHDIYWWTGPDDSRLLMKWNSMLRRNDEIGGYAEARHIPDIIDYADTDASFRARYPYDVIGIFGYGWDHLDEKTNKFVTAAKQKTTGSRQVIVSNEIDFFEDFERTYGAALPSLSVGFGNDWDLLSASMAELTGSVKRGVEKMRAAEALASFVSLQNPDFMRGREKDREKAWLGLGMYYDHDWTADGHISRDAREQWQREQAADFLIYVENLHRDAVGELGRMIRTSGSNQRFFVFNPLGWQRTDAADFAYDGSDDIHVLDRTDNSEVPSQIVTVDGVRLLRIWAENVPPMGYKVYEIAPGPGGLSGGGPDASGSVLENGSVRVVLGDNGAVTSYIDKNSGSRELVRNVNGRHWNELGSAAGSLQVVNLGPVSATIQADSSTPLAHKTAVTLYRDGKRIDIENRITQNFGDVHDWGFGFNLDNPNFYHEEIGAVIKAALTGAGGAYSSRNARYDWLTLNHFVDVHNGSAGVTLSSADLSFMRTGNSSTEFLDTTTPQVSVLAGGQVDGTHLGIRSQGGDSFFLQRFALRSHDGYSAAAAMRFALEHQNPLVTGEVMGGQIYPGNTYSLLHLNDPNVLIWALKPSDEPGDTSLVLRVWNLSNAPVSTKAVFSGYSILEAERLTHIETPIETLQPDGSSIDLSPAKWQWQTFRLKLDGVPASSSKGIGKKVIR